MPSQRLLIIDDEFDIAVLVKEVAEDCGYDVRITVEFELLQADLRQFRARI